jgi:hypothetical protein
MSPGSNDAIYSSMNNKPAHLLTQMGVLTSFSVAKKITEDDIKSLIKKEKKSLQNDEDVSEVIKLKIMDEIKEALHNGKIPGLIHPLDGITKDLQGKLGELNRLIMVVSHKILEKKMDKFSMCYIINTMVNVLGLSDKDFEEFHKKVLNHNLDSDDDEDDDEDEGDEIE